MGIFLGLFFYGAHLEHKLAIIEKILSSRRCLRSRVALRQRLRAVVVAVAISKPYGHLLALVSDLGSSLQPLVASIEMLCRGPGEPLVVRACVHACAHAGI